MAIQSADQLITAITAGQMYRSDWNKNNPSGTQGVGQWYDLSQGAGNPTVNAVIGSTTNLAHQAVAETTSTTATTSGANGNFATSVFTDTTHGTGRFTVGMLLTGGTIPAGTYITSLGTGTGANNGGTYNLSTTPGTLSNVSTTGTAYTYSIPSGGNVSALVKNLLNANVFSAAATSAPAVFMLYDMLAVYTISSITTTGQQAFTGQSAWPRYADGKGVRAFLVPSIVMGAGAPTVQLQYTNTTPTAGRLTPSGPALPTITTTSAVGAVPYSGTGAGKYGPFLPMMAGDAGMVSVEYINFSATMTTGCMNLVICKPLVTIPITTVGVAGERDLVNQLPSMPIIQDGACLNWLMYAGAATPANTAYYGNLDFAWG
jgi:hypothetical protein